MEEHQRKVDSLFVLYVAASAIVQLVSLGTGFPEGDRGRWFALEGGKRVRTHGRGAGEGGVVGSGSVSRTSAMKAKRCRQTALKPRSEVWGSPVKALKVEQEARQGNQSAGKFCLWTLASFQN